MSIKSALRSAPGVLPLWRFCKRMPFVQNLVDDIYLWRTYGRWRPDCVSLPDSEQKIFADPRENRGKALLKNHAQGQPYTKWFWKAVCAELQPTIVVDVGLNYGEIVLAETYSPTARILGIEANPRLQPWLERSREIHPNRDQIQFVSALAADKCSSNEKFYINKKWSGSSSAILDPKRPGVVTCEVPSVSVDSLLTDVIDNKLASGEHVLLLKIDVEGYEPPVMRGMQQTFACSSKWAGIIEFNEGFFPRLGIGVEDYIAELLKMAEVRALCHDGRLVPLTSPKIADWHEKLGPETIEVDLILTSHGLKLQALEAWPFPKSKQGSK